MLNAVLQNNRYPATLYTDTLIRIRSEQGNITCGRAAIIKAVLMKNYNWKEGEKFMGLNEDCKETAYVLDAKSFAVTGGEFGMEASVISLVGYIIVTGVAFFGNKELCDIIYKKE